VCVGPQAGEGGVSEPASMEGKGHTDYSSHCAGSEVLPTVQLDLLLREDILDFRHRGCLALQFDQLSSLSRSRQRRPSTGSIWLNHDEGRSIDRHRTERRGE
jgi:hypothetical protein